MIMQKKKRKKVENGIFGGVSKFQNSEFLNFFEILSPNNIFSVKYGIYTVRLPLLFLEHILFRKKMFEILKK